MPKISIIVPVYNSEKSLEKCVGSILRQDFKDFELILIDDGSTDASPEICDSFQSADSRVKVIHKKNSGVSDCRNIGISQAQGEFIQFVDSDDWISHDSSAMMLHSITENKCDMVITDFYRVIGEYLSQKGSISKAGMLSREEFALKMLENPADFYYGVLWNKLYRKDIIEKYHIRMDESISWCEDFIFNMDYIRHTKRIYVLPIPIYYYIKTEGSLVSQGSSITKTIQMKQMVFKSYKEFYKDIFQEEDYEKIRFSVYRFLLDIAGDGSVPPAIFPGTKKLGDERVAVKNTVKDLESSFLWGYKERKLQDQFFESIALKHRLNLDEIRILYCVHEMGDYAKIQDISEILEIPTVRLNIWCMLLVEEEYLRYENVLENEKKESAVRIEKTENGKNIVDEIDRATKAVQNIKYKGLTAEEIHIFENIWNKVQNNMDSSIL